MPVTESCPFCPKPFESAAGMGWHIDHHHPDKKAEFKGLVAGIRAKLKGNVPTPRGTKKAPPVAVPEVGCDLCPMRFGSAVALRFHIRKEHPGAYDAMGPVFRRMEATERAVKKERAPDLTSVDALYRMGCPCGRTYEEHMADRARVGWS